MARDILRLAGLLWIWAVPAAAEMSNAAAWLRDEQIAEACGPAGGTMAEAGLREIDLNGDGARDLILDHAEITCNRDRQRSDYCGVQVCSVYLYLREGGLLVRRDEILGLIESVSDDPIPVIRGISHGGGQWSVVWSESGFQPAD